MEAKKQKKNQRPNKILEKKSIRTEAPGALIGGGRGQRTHPTGGGEEWVWIKTKGGIERGQEIKTTAFRWKEAKEIKAREKEQPRGEKLQGRRKKISSELPKDPNISVHPEELGVRGKTLGIAIIGHRPELDKKRRKNFHRQRRGETGRWTESGDREMPCGKTQSHRKRKGNKTREVGQVGRSSKQEKSSTSVGEGQDKNPCGIQLAQIKNEGRGEGGEKKVTQKKN